MSLLLHRDRRRQSVSHACGVLVGRWPTGSLCADPSTGCYCSGGSPPCKVLVWLPLQQLGYWSGSHEIPVVLLVGRGCTARHQAGEHPTCRYPASDISQAPCRRPHTVCFLCERACGRPVLAAVVDAPQSRSGGPHTQGPGGRGNRRDLLRSSWTSAGTRDRQTQVVRLHTGRARAGVLNPRAMQDRNTTCGPDGCTRPLASVACTRDMPGHVIGIRYRRNCQVAEERLYCGRRAHVLRQRNSPCHEGALARAIVASRASL